MSDREGRTDERRREDERAGERRRDGPADERRREERETSPVEESVEAVAASTARVGFLILGVVILLYATGQLVGFDVLAMLSDVFDTREARWITVAFFGLVLITLALRGFRARRGREPR